MMKKATHILQILRMMILTLTTFPDYEEIFEFETDPNNSDTDGDGSPDGTEIDEDTDPLVSDIQDEDEDTDTAEDIDEDVAVVEDTDEDEDAETEKLASIEDCTPFEDIISHWSESDVCTLYTAGFVKGKSEKFMTLTTK